MLCFTQKSAMSVRFTSPSSTPSPKCHKHCWASSSRMMRTSLTIAATLLGAAGFASGAAGRSPGGAAPGTCAVASSGPVAFRTTTHKAINATTSAPVMACRCQGRRLLQEFRTRVRDMAVPPLTVAPASCRAGNTDGPRRRSSAGFVRRGSIEPGRKTGQARLAHAGKGSRVPALPST